MSQTDRAVKLDLMFDIADSTICKLPDFIVYNQSSPFQARCSLLIFDISQKHAYKIKAKDCVQIVNLYKNRGKATELYFFVHFVSIVIIYSDMIYSFIDSN